MTVQLISDGQSGLSVRSAINNNATNLDNRVTALEGQVYLQILGDWNAATNTPNVLTSPIDPGQAYVVSVAGNTNVGGITDWQVGDLIVRKADNSGYFKIDNSDNTSLQKAANLSDLENIATARTNLGVYSKAQVDIITGILESDIYNTAEALGLKADQATTYTKDETDDLLANKIDVGATTTDIPEGDNLYFTAERAQDSVGGSLTDTSTIDFTYNDGSNTISADVKDGSIDNTKIAAGIDAAKLANGSVSDAEFQYLNGVTGSIQTQLDGKQALISTPTDNNIVTTNSSGQTLDSGKAFSNDGTMAANSDALVSTQKASKTYTDTVAASKVADAINDGVTSVAPSQNSVFDALALKANLASPALTGSPTAPTVNIATNDHTIATTAFVQSLVASSIVSGRSFRGAYDASSGSYPSTDGSGSGGAIIGGDHWLISVAGTLGGEAVQAGDLLYAIVDTPGQTDSNWQVIDQNLGYTPENVANKATSLSTSNDTLYPSVKAVVDALALKANASSVTGSTKTKVTYNSEGVITDGEDATTTDIAEGDNLYFTNSRAQAASVEDAINSGTTNKAPSEDAVYTALALKAPLASPALTGTPTAPTASAGTNTAQVATTAYALAAAQSYSSGTNTKVYYVSTAGNDLNNGNTPQTAFLTLSAALTAAGNSGNQVCVMPGTYAGNYTINNLNVDIVSANNTPGGICYFSGTITVSNASSSVRFRGLTIDTVVHNSAGGFYMYDCNVNTSLSSTSTGYIEVNSTNTQGGSGTGVVSFTGAATKVVNGGKLGFLTVNNASCVASVTNMINCAPITLTLGTLGIGNSVVYAATGSSNAIAVAAGVILVNNVTCLTPTATPARVSFGASSVYSIREMFFDKSNSTLSGTAAPQALVTDLIDTTNLTLSSGSVNQILATNGSKTLQTLNTSTYPSLTELSYVKGVTSEIQYQFGGKQATLVSGTNIKTVAGVNLLGSGDVTSDYIVANQSNGNTTLGKLQAIAATTILGNSTGSTATAQELSASSVRTMLGTPKHNQGSSSPGVGNDNTQGYSVGSQWFNNVTNVLYEATGVSSGAAVWVVAGGGSFSPTITSALTYEGIYYNGSGWVNGLPVIPPTISLNANAKTVSVTSSFATSSPFWLNGSASYHYQASTVSNFASIAFETTTSSTSWNPAFVGGTLYYVRVQQAMVFNGQTYKYSDYCTTQSFTPVGDAIRAALSTSISAYDAASVGQCVNITQAEFNNLPNTVSNLTDCGIPSANNFWANNAIYGQYSRSATYIHMMYDPTQTIFANFGSGTRYCVGFKILSNGVGGGVNCYLYASNSNSTTGDALQIATNPISNSMPMYSGTIYYFCIKQPQNNVGGHYPFFFGNVGGSNCLSFADIGLYGAGGGILNQFCETVTTNIAINSYSSGPAAASAVAAINFLQTTTKQWT